MGHLQQNNLVPQAHNTHQIYLSTTRAIYNRTTFSTGSLHTPGLLVYYIGHLQQNNLVPQAHNTHQVNLSTTWAIYNRTTLFHRLTTHTRLTCLLHGPSTTEQPCSTGSLHTPGLLVYYMGHLQQNNLVPQAHNTHQIYLSTTWAIYNRTTLFHRLTTHTRFTCLLHGPSTTEQPCSTGSQRTPGLLVYYMGHLQQNNLVPQAHYTHQVYLSTTWAIYNRTTLFHRLTTHTRFTCLLHGPSTIEQPCSTGSQHTPGLLVYYMGHLQQNNLVPQAHNAHQVYLSTTWAIYNRTTFSTGSQYTPGLLVYYNDTIMNTFCYIQGIISFR